MTKGIERNGYILDYLGGSVPVQGEGTIDGLPFYFRARGGQWSLEIGRDANLPWDDIQVPVWWHVEEWGTWPEAGYMPEDVALAMIDKAVALYREQKPTRITPHYPDWEGHVLRAWSDEIIATKAVTILLDVEEEEIEKRAVERGLPINSYHELDKRSKAARQALAAEMEPFNFPKDFHERERAILIAWGRGTVALDQAARFLGNSEEDVPKRARFLGIPAPNEGEDNG
ncbi:hypothetical protein B5E41_30150 [Rhizobium esperanzae]|uniref:Uncharacterized protein n=1 Tax=Rhizobium esperanzae TaxID=1967781 RepID=A0A246DKQ4_9HYPH|nr:hypothetical protein [Rhizobium esperanzae]OWO89704.1 hypothetical protein B5E41_30150 [Rhizobium esperanzae]